MNKSNTKYKSPSLVRSRGLLLVTLMLTTACFTLKEQASNEDSFSNLETPISALETTASCPVTPIIEDFWSEVGPVAGTFPVWISSRGHVPYSKLGRIVLPPESGELTFIEGRSTKALVFVDKSIEGDLTITGKRLDGPELIYFTDSDGLFADIDDSTLQLIKIPPTVKTISPANISSHFPEPDGKAHHGMGLLYLSPGCYQFTTTIDQFTVQIVLELVNE